MKGYEDLGPGLHRIGPEPWDFAFNPARGLRVSVVLSDGQLRTSVITDCT